uniref:Large ribosomal subunit protein bL32c n=1 Tax=Cyphia dentariifolia TaxID=2041117 RepID=A0A291F415_9ASTR|nr:ribosomal protein L32 [Cyphia dentariifolia]ATG26852.1 ribosomal protein L32 [Cyphia dentariifolia]
MAVPKKRTSRSKKRIRKNIWKGKAYGSRLRALTLGAALFFKNFLAGKNITKAGKNITNRKKEN